MNNAKTSNYGKLIAFFLIASVLVCTVGFAADGWQATTQTKPDSGNVGENTDDADENKDGNDEPDTPSVYIPEHVSALTGLETTPELAMKRPVCFVMSSTSPLYGISSADVVVEMPTEGGETRLLAFVSDTKDIGKIGSLTPTRKYISNIARYFGAITVANGNDDSIVYEGCDLASSYFDLSIESGYHYTEYTHFLYTNGALIGAGISNANIGTALNTRHTLPYSFTDFGAERVSGTETARSVSIPYSKGSETEFYYSDASGKYTLAKGGAPKVDMLNDETLAYDNLFILFADTVTYESADASQMVMNTVSSGSGYYLSGGTAMAIRYEASLDGEMIFYNESGERLTVNRGTSYIGFVKSSMKSEIRLSTAQ